MGLIDKLVSVFNRRSTDTLKDLTGSLDDSISKLSNGIGLIPVEAVIPSATGDWLNELGSWYGVDRKLNEADSDYYPRIIDKVQKSKNTISALVTCTQNVLGTQNVTPHETYNDVRVYSQSTFSGTGRFQDSDTYRIGIVILYVDQPVTDTLVAEIDKVRACGITVKLIHQQSGAVTMSSTSSLNA